MIKPFLSRLEEQSKDISSARREDLDKLAAIITEDLVKGDSVVKFICTHNSRRSQVAEFMLDVLSREYGLKITALSAGTEATAFEPRMVNAIKNQGFPLIEYGNKPNPLYIYRIKNDDLYYFSKRYDEQLIDYGESIIVTVCGDANENCPVIPGTLKRFHLGYEDPKKSDGSDHESETYKKKVLEIGSEILYLVKAIAGNN